jgi:5-methylcytosine-specific restriction endonuclease McrA
MLQKTCTKCYLQKPLDDFPWKYKTLGVRHAVCKTCTAQRSNVWYQENKTAHIQNVKANKDQARIEARIFIFEYLASHPCKKCGESDPVVLEFDHLRDKEKNVANLIDDGASIERLERELSRCQVLCANCHRRKTAKDRGWFRGKL